MFKVQSNDIPTFGIYAPFPNQSFALYCREAGLPIRPTSGTVFVFKVQSNDIRRFGIYASFQVKVLPDYAEWPGCQPGLHRAQFYLKSVW